MRNTSVSLPADTIIGPCWRLVCPPIGSYEESPSFMPDLMSDQNIRDFCPKKATVFVTPIKVIKDSKNFGRKDRSRKYLQLQHSVGLNLGDAKPQLK